jgi:hypothetical protein
MNVQKVLWIGVWLAAAAWGGAASGGPKYQGRVSKAKAGELVVIVGTEEFTFVVPRSARIRVDGRSGSLEAIRQGATAVVEAERFGDVRIARRIDARRAPRREGHSHESHAYQDDSQHSAEGNGAHKTKVEPRSRPGG